MELGRIVNDALPDGVASVKDNKNRNNLKVQIYKLQHNLSQNVFNIRRRKYKKFVTQTLTIEDLYFYTEAIYSRHPHFPCPLLKVFRIGRFLKIPKRRQTANSVLGISLQLVTLKHPCLQAISTPTPHRNFYTESAIDDETIR